MAFPDFMYQAKWMLWEDEPAKESVERLRALGVQSVVFDPCANRPASGDVLGVMRSNASHLKQAFQYPERRRRSSTTA